ncbi:MAG: Ig-like domain-containing protein [Lachnospiraceae bacterium]|nr:Ig-like domain-containing protein [Lachnospiraceae bacterium]
MIGNRKKSAKKGSQSAGKKPPKKKAQEKVLVTGTTEILDFNLEEELEKQQEIVREKETSVKKEQLEEIAAEQREETAQNQEETEISVEQKPVQNVSKEAADQWQEQMPDRPVALGEDTMELLGIEELLPKPEKKAKGGKDGSYLDFVPKKQSRPETSKSEQRPNRSAAKSNPGEGKKKRSAAGADRSGGRTKKKSGLFEDFNVMDVVIGITGVAVLFVAVVAIGVYSNAASLKKQVAAVADVGVKMENIGYAGGGIFTAVADARVAAQEAAELLEESEDPYTYEEKELESDVSVALKLTSVQKDLKIKFTNKNSGKLIGNQPFAVKIEGPQSMEKTDDDEDGIIYINSITPGEYTVTITAPDEVDGSKAAGTKALVTVKDKIEYKKIDVTDEVKTESEINAAKEDTKVATQIESVQTDTVEWVESTKTALEGSGTGTATYEKVNKSEIPDPSATAVLDMIWTADGKNGAYIVQDSFQLSQNASWASEKIVKQLTQGVYFTQEKESSESGESESAVMPLAQSQPAESQPSESQPSESQPAESQPSESQPAESQPSTESSAPSEPEESQTPSFEVTGVTISGHRDCTVGEEITLHAEVTTKGEGLAENLEYQWSGASGNGKSAVFKAASEGSHTVSVKVGGQSASVSINVSKKAAEVTGLTLSADKTSADVGQKITFTASVTMSDGSAYNGSINWSTTGAALTSGGTTATLSSDSAGEFTVTASTSNGKASQSTKVTFKAVVVEKKVTAIKLPDSLSVVAGKKGALSCEVEPSDAANKSVEWTVTEGSDCISIDQSGNVTGKKAGTAKVQAAARDGSGIRSNVCTVTVTSGIGISMDAPGSIRVGEEKALTCNASGDYNKDSIEWSSSDSKIASVDASTGKVTGLAQGKVTITVKVKSSDGKEEAKASGELTVSTASVDEIKVDPSGITLKVGEKATINASVSTNGSKAVTWKSNDESMVKIVESDDDSCVIEALKAGTIRVVATSKENSEKTAYCEVSIEPKNPNALLKDAAGNQLYVKDGDTYREAIVADYYKYDVFYRKKDTTQYLYTGWQNIDGKRYYFDKNGNPVTGDQTIQGMKYSFNSDGSLKVNGSMGIDISKHNGSIDWNAVKNAGVNYVIIRCGYRGSATGVLVEDPKFKTNIQGAAAAGLKVGIYFFSQAVNEVEAVEEASMAVSLIRKYNITYPVYMDVEDANGRADGLDAGTRTAVIKAFCETVRNSGYTAGVYANKTWLTSKMNVGSLGSYKIWLAQYAATPTYSGRYEMWQYSCTGKISGISGNVDLNISYMSY